LLERLSIMFDRADGFVAVRGGIGTLSEVTLAWSLLQTRSLAPKPLVLMGADWQAVIDAWRGHTTWQLHRRAGPRRLDPGRRIGRPRRAPNTSRPSAPRLTGRGGRAAITTTACRWTKVGVVRIAYCVVRSLSIMSRLFKRDAQCCGRGHVP